jgi:hypothetical protein
MSDMETDLPPAISDGVTAIEPFEVSGAKYNALASLGLEDGDILTEEVKENDSQSMLG